jgi:hypothetical protein
MAARNSIFAVFSACFFCELIDSRNCLIRLVINGIFIKNGTAICTLPQPLAPATLHLYPYFSPPY